MFGEWITEKILYPLPHRQYVFTLPKMLRPYLGSILLELAKQRAAEACYSITFQLGSATHLPWPNDSLDVCLMVELLEHVPNGKAA